MEDQLGHCDDDGRWKILKSINEINKNNATIKAATHSSLNCVLKRYSKFGGCYQESSVAPVNKPCLRDEKEQLVSRH